MSQKKNEGIPFPTEIRVVGSYTDRLLNPKSNHPKHVFRGLVRTECMRYIRNSLCEDDYMLSLKLFTLRLLKAGYTKGFIHRNVISYKEGLYRMKFKRTERSLGGLFVYPLIYDKVDSVYIRRENTNEGEGRFTLTSRFFHF